MSTIDLSGHDLRGLTHQFADGFTGRLLDALTSVEQVIVLGHSLSPVDAAYFTALIEQRSVAEAKWQVACRLCEEWPEKRVLLAQLGIDPAVAAPVLWDAL